MTIEETIKKAIEGGYEPNGSDLQHYMLFNQHAHISALNLVGYKVIFLDPLFWQSLGKAMGWRYKAYKNGAWQTEDEDLDIMSDTPFRHPEWLYQWHKFIDHLAEGKDINSFFKNL